MRKDKHKKGQGLKTRQGIEQETHLMRNTQTQDSDGDVSFKRTQKSDRMEDDQDDPPQNKVKDSGNLLVDPDPVAKMMS